MLASGIKIDTESETHCKPIYFRIKNINRVNRIE